MDNNKEEYTKVIKCGKCGQMRLPEEGCDCDPSPQSPVNEDWEKEYDEKVGCFSFNTREPLDYHGVRYSQGNDVIKDFIRKQRQEAYEEGLKERCQNMLSKEETYLKAQHELAEEIMDYMENGLDEPTDWYVSVKNFLLSRGLLPKITE